MSVNLSLDSTVQSEPLDPSPTTSSPVDSAVANYEALYESALQSIQQMLQQVFAEEGSLGAGNTGSPSANQQMLWTLVGVIAFS